MVRLKTKHIDHTVCTIVVWGDVAIVSSTENGLCIKCYRSVEKRLLKWRKNLKIRRRIMINKRKRFAQTAVKPASPVSHQIHGYHRIGYCK